MSEPTSPVRTDAELIARSSARLHVLAKVSQAFAIVATDYARLVENIARTSADLVGDGCMVTLIAADGETMVNAASAHRDPELETVYREFLAGVGVSTTTSNSVSAVVARTGEPKLVTDVVPAEMVAQADDTLKPLVARLDVHSFAVVPIRARGGIIGTLSLLRSRPGFNYTPDDLTLLLDLAERAGLAIENARLYADLEARVRVRTAELELLNRELEAFSYSVAHDLRAPLRQISGFSQALIEDHADQLDPTATTYLGSLREAARRMSEMIDGLMDLARVTRSALHRDRVDVSTLAAAVVARLRELDPGRAVEVTIEPNLVAHADGRLVEVVLANLLGNAWKFTRGRDRAHVEVGAVADIRPTTWFVRDDGVGFASADAKLVFQPFRRAHASDQFEGTGIGLATVQRVVHRHAGRVWADADLDRGATFFFTLEPDAS